MTDSGVTMSVTPGPPGGKMITRTDSSLSKQAATSQASGQVIRSLGQVITSIRSAALECRAGSVSLGIGG